MIGTGSLTNSQVAALAAATMATTRANWDKSNKPFDDWFDHILSKLDSVKPTEDIRTFGDA